MKDRKGHFQVCLFEEKKNQDYIRITEIIWNHIRMTQNLRKLWLLGAPTLVQAKGKHIGIPLFVRAGLSRGVSRLEVPTWRRSCFPLSGCRAPHTRLDKLSEDTTGGTNLLAHKQGILLGPVWSCFSLDEGRPCWEW